MTQAERASKLGITQGYFSKLFNGWQLPSFEAAERWRKMTGWTYQRWQASTISQRQKMLLRVTEGN